MGHGAWFSSTAGWGKQRRGAGGSTICVCVCVYNFFLIKKEIGSNYGKNITNWRQGIRNSFSEDLGRKENRKWGCIALVLLKSRMLLYT